MAKKENNQPTKVFRDDKHALLTIAVIIGVALIAFNFDKMTGGAINEPNTLSIFQDGKSITVQVNYPAGKYGKSNNIIDMRAAVGSNLEDQTTKCDVDRGYVSRGTSKCKREIAEFYIVGDKWSVGDDVVFSVRGTNIKRDYKIRR